MPATITVREKAEQYQAPERATVNMVIDITGYDREHVHMQVASSLRKVREDIERMRHDQDGPVTWHAISNANSWSWKNDDGVRFREQVEIKVKFSDFSTLGVWLTGILLLDGTRLNRIDWALTEQHKKELEQQLRQAAVQLAREKADQYAAAAGLRISAVKTIADIGLLGDGRGIMDYSTASFGAARGSALGMDSSAADGYSFAPEDVLISASVDVEFLAE